MSGSGTAYFGLCRHARHARRVARHLQALQRGRVYILQRDEIQQVGFQVTHGAAPFLLPTQADDRSRHLVSLVWPGHSDSQKRSGP